MSYEEKGVWVQLVVNVVGFVAYAGVILVRADGGPIGLNPGMALLVLDIGRYGEYVAGGVLGVGMLVPFGLTLAEAGYFWIANAMYVAFLASSLAGIGSKLVGYRRGYHRAL